MLTRTASVPQIATASAAPPSRPTMIPMPVPNQLIAAHHHDQDQEYCQDRVNHTYGRSEKLVDPICEIHGFAAFLTGSKF